MQYGRLAAEEGTRDRMQDALPYHSPSPPTTPSPRAGAADRKRFSPWSKLAPSQGGSSAAVMGIPKMNQSVQIAP